MSVDYNYTLNTHALEGPRKAFSSLLPGSLPSSVLDVGCCTGTWLRAALDAGVAQVVGIDGVDIPEDQLLIPRECFLLRDLTTAVDLGRRFDLVICLEVAEHLDVKHADTLIHTLTLHSDCIVFSAAAPNQPGQHHVNCEPPSTWQKRFNKLGFACDDEVRWRLWNEACLEPWYRQNIFIARNDPQRASKEPRINTVIHPDLFGQLVPDPAVARIESGRMPTKWYLELLGKALNSKVRRHRGATICSS